MESKLVLRSDPAALRVVLAAPLTVLEVPPKDATFAINGTAVSVVPAVIGQLVNLDSVANQIARGAHLHAIDAEVADVNPTRTTEWAQKRITELVSTFTTNHNCCEGEPGHQHPPRRRCDQRDRSCSPVRPSR